MPTLVKLVSPEEAAEHSTREDCWIIVDGKVYDVTEYLSDHPGGDDIIVNVADEFEDAGHSKTARELLKGFCVGEVDLNSTATVAAEANSSSSALSQLLFTRAISPLKLWAAAAIAVAGVSVAAGVVYCRRK
ncbi:cytochrome b5-like isoform X2 [Wolffia australiana]